MVQLQKVFLCTKPCRSGKVECKHEKKLWGGVNLIKVESILAGK